MQLRLTVTGDDAPAAMRSLQAWLAGQDELRGRVRPLVAAPQPGAMGSVTEVLLVTLGPGGVASAVASVLISWIRRQSGPVRVRVTRPDGTEVELDADHVRGLSMEEVRSLVAKLRAMLKSVGAVE